MLLADLIAQLQALAPESGAEDWDNVGLIVGDRAAPVRRVLLCIDLTQPVLEEAVRERCECVIAYHPVIFEPLRRFCVGEAAFEAARRGIAVYCPHTALDSAPGGTNDVLAEIAGLSDVRPLRRGRAEAAGFVKLVTFIPPGAVERVSAAVFAAGAGRIGNYGECSFRGDGIGSFRGDEGANPAIGQAGKLETTPEVRWETVAPIHRLAEVIAALKAAHPYEEPAFDVFPQLRPVGWPGPGRIGERAETSAGQVARELKSRLGLSGVLLAGSPDHRVQRVAVCAGSGRGLVDDVLAAGADLYLTGELPHHDALRLLRGGVASLCTLHSNSERPALAALARRLTGVEARLSSMDRDPFALA